MDVDNRLGQSQGMATQNRTSTLCASGQGQQGASSQGNRAAQPGQCRCL